MPDERMNLDGLTLSELASLDDGSGDIYGARADRRAGLLRMLDMAEMRVALGVLMETHPEIFDEIVASVPQAWRTDWQPLPPDAIEAIVADSIENRGQYSNALRHLPVELPVSHVCKSGNHQSCGGGLVTAKEICQCDCHKSRGRPALARRK